MRKALFLASLAVLWLLPGAVSAATALKAGDLIKMPGVSTVYYYAEDQRRYVFPNEGTYFTWYSSFAGVKSVTPAQMAALPIGGNIVYRPGARLLKLQSDNIVYAVEPHGLLRRIPDEATAASIYGPGWAKRVDDLPDSLFFDYGMGKAVSSGVYPTGSVVKRVADGALFYIDGAGKRRIVSAEAKENLRTQDQFVLSDKSDLSAYADGEPIYATEVELADTAQLRRVALGQGNQGGTGTAAPGPTYQRRDNFELTAGPLTTGSQTAVTGAKKVTLGAFSFNASSKSVNIVKSVSFMAYIDDRLTEYAGFSPGSDINAGVRTYARDLAPYVGLYDESGNLVGGPVAVSDGGSLGFANLSISIPPGETRVFYLKGDIRSGFDVGPAGFGLAFDVVNAPTDMVVTDPAGNRLTVTGAAPNGGAVPHWAVIVIRSGRVEFSWVGNTSFGVIGRSYDLGKLNLATKNDDFELRQLSIHVANDVKSIRQMTLTYQNASGTEVVVTQPYGGPVTTFNGLAVPLTRGTLSTLVVGVVLKTRDQGAVNEEVVRADIPLTAPLELVSTTSGNTVRQDSLNTPDFPLENRTSELTVRYTLISFATSAGTPAGIIGRSQYQPVLKFGIKAEPEGTARVGHLTFKIVPSDAGQSGADNDLLEKWTESIGVFSNANALVQLWMLSPGERRLAGTEGLRSVKLSLADKNGVKYPNQTGYTSTAGDYGLLTYDLTTGFEETIPAGQTVSYELDIDTSKLNIGTQTVKAVILSGFDLQWTDTASGYYEPITGAEIAGLPLESPLLTVP